MHGTVAEFMIAEHAATGTTTWNWSAWWKCGRVTAPGPFSTRKAIGCSASSAGGFSFGGKV
jgi:hypothetical protein